MEPTPTQKIVYMLAQLCSIIAASKGVKMTAQDAIPDYWNDPEPTEDVAAQALRVFKSIARTGSWRT